MVSRGQRGISLVEVVIAIVVLGTALAAIYGGLASITVQSVDPMLQRQGLAIAEAYMEEILAKRMADGACPAVPASGNRKDYSCVCHYNGLSNNAGAENQLGQVPTALADFNVGVQINSQSLHDISSVDAKDIVVSVTHDNADINVVLTGYRARYGDQSCDE